MLMVYLLKYLQGSTYKDIRFSFDLHVFSDSDRAGDQVTKRSTTGDIVLACGGPIVWQSKLQNTSSTSSLQEEYQAVYAGMQELVWLRGGGFCEIGRPEDEPTPFFIDGQSAEDITLNLVSKKGPNRYVDQRVRGSRWTWSSEVGACGVCESGSGPIHKHVMWPNVRGTS